MVDVYVYGVYDRECAEIVSLGDTSEVSTVGLFMKINNEYVRLVVKEK